MKFRIQASCMWALFWVAVAPAVAQSQPPDKQRSDSKIDVAGLEELNLTDAMDLSISIASGKMQAIEEAPSIVSVYTDEDIRRLGVQTLQELLKIVPGFDALVDGTGRDRINVRGFTFAGSTSGGVLILFNGHRLNDQIINEATRTNVIIPLYNIRRVEIIRGPGSALYGANAFVAVINLIPFSPTNFNGTRTSVTAGSFGTQQYNVITAVSGANWGILGTAQYTDSDRGKLFVTQDLQTVLDRGLSAAPFFRPKASLAPGLMDQSLRSEDTSANGFYKDLTWNLRFKNDEAGPSLGRLDTLTEDGRLYGQQLLLDASQRVSLGKRVSADLKFSFTQTRNRERTGVLPKNSAFPSGGTLLVFPDGMKIDFSTNSRNYLAELTTRTQLSDKHQITIGAAFETESPYDLYAAGNFSGRFNQPPVRVVPELIRQPDVVQGTRSIGSAFVQQDWTVAKPVSFTAGVRYDHHNDFGSSVNPRAALVWRMPRGFFSKFLYGRAFRAPTVAELNYHILGIIEGNPSLRPGSVNTVEVALGYKSKRLRGSMDYFSNYIRNFVGTVSAAIPGELFGVTTFRNFEGMNAHGLEAELTRTFGVDSALFVNYTYQQSRDLNGNHRGEISTSIANFGGTLGLTRYLSFSPIVTAIGPKLRYARDVRPPTPGYALLNLNVRVRNIWSTLELNATMNNALNKEYVDPQNTDRVVLTDYPRPGRRFLVGALYRF